MKPLLLRTAHLNGLYFDLDHVNRWKKHLEKVPLESKHHLLFLIVSAFHVKIVSLG